MAEKTRDESLIQIEEAREAIRDSVERAHELVVEAKLVLRPQVNEEPPNPAS